MPLNAQLHLVLDSESLEELRKEAEFSKTSISELCRQKLSQQPPLRRIEYLLEEIRDKVGRKR